MSKDLKTPLTDAPGDSKAPLEYSFKESTTPLADESPRDSRTPLADASARPTSEAFEPLFGYRTKKDSEETLEPTSPFSAPLPQDVDVSNVR